jgi:hypothetical protein
MECEVEQLLSGVSEEPCCFFVAGENSPGLVEEEHGIVCFFEGESGLDLIRVGAGCCVFFAVLGGSSFHSLGTPHAEDPVSKGGRSG